MKNLVGFLKQHQRKIGSAVLDSVRTVGATPEELYEERNNPGSFQGSTVYKRAVGAIDLANDVKSLYEKNRGKM